MDGEFLLFLLLQSAPKSYARVNALLFQGVAHIIAVSINEICSRNL